jgi:hypothetical protein
MFMTTTTTTAFYAACLAALWLSTGCGAAAPSAIGAHDVPPPASAARARLAFVLDLPASSACEEQFDLALYQSPQVVLVEWPESTPRCNGRTAIVTYLTKDLSAHAAQQLVAQHARVRSVAALR